MENQQTDDCKIITMQKRVTPALQEAARTNGAKAADVVRTQAHRDKLAAGQKRRREAERMQKEANPPPPSEPKPMGRPRTRPVADPDTPKRGKGRPSGSRNKVNSGAQEVPSA